MPDARLVISEVIRQDHGRLLSALVGSLRDFDLAEESLGDAIESAVIHWGRTGPPDNPRAWLMRVARRKAIDRIRRKGRFADRVKDIELLAQADQEAAAEDPPEIPDERLALIFTCCHPALDLKSRVALTLRSLGGLSTGDVARAFLDSEPTMGQRLSRAKTKIARAGIGFGVPGKELWAERLDSVLLVIYLIFNQCYGVDPSPEAGGDDDLCAEATYLARMLRQMLPDEEEVRALLALLLLVDARRAARRDAEGRAVPIPQQDGALWHPEKLAEWLALVEGGPPDAAAGPFRLQAKIMAEHMRHGPGRTDWARVLALYDRLQEIQDTTVIALNRAVAVARVLGPEAALRAIEPLAADLATYQPFHAARADFLAQAGRDAEARAAYDTAIATAATAADVAFLAARRAALPD